jgi:hypothetical protein
METRNHHDGAGFDIPREDGEDRPVAEAGLEGIDLTQAKQEHLESVRKTLEELQPHDRITETVAFWMEDSDWVLIRNKKTGMHYRLEWDYIGPEPEEERTPPEGYQVMEGPQTPKVLVKRDVFLCRTVEIAGETVGFWQPEHLQASWDPEREAINAAEVRERLTNAEAARLWEALSPVDCIVIERGVEPDPPPLPGPPRNP